MFGNNYSVKIDQILDEYVLSLKYTFGDIVKYVGTTTNKSVEGNRIRDIDVIVVFKQLAESHISYIWKIINKLHLKYNIYLDTRVYSEEQIFDDNYLHVLNRHLLKIYLTDLLGENPFKYYIVKNNVLMKECFDKIKKQEQNILDKIPRIAGEPEQIRGIAQDVYDAVRAFLIIKEHPIASKEEVCEYFKITYPKFKEAEAIYGAYLDPYSIIDVTGYIRDCLAIVRHLLYLSEEKPLCNEVLLINTPSFVTPHPRDAYISCDNNMPLGLVCLSTHLSASGISNNILDAYANNMGVLATIDNIFRKKKIPKVIGMNTSSPNIHIAHTIASYIKRINPNIILVCGGPHASIATKHALSTGDFDYAVIGEGEIPLTKLVHGVFTNKKNKVGNIPGVYRSVGGHIVGSTNSDIYDLKKMKTPDFSKLPIERYFGVRKRLYIHTTRGCAYNCIYCSVPKCWGNKVREIPINITISHIKNIIKKYKPDQIQIVDDNFSHNNGALIMKYCKGISENKIKVKWKCQVRPDQINKNNIEQMKKAGCFEIDLGIESGNPEIQKYIRKGLNLEKTKTVVNNISEAGIYVKAFFMLGFPEESYKQITDTINYAVELKQCGLNDLAFFNVMPFPGTDLSAKTGKETLQGAVIDNVDRTDRTYSGTRLRKYSAKPEISLNTNFTPEELRLLVKFAYNHFHFGVFVKDLKVEFEEFKMLEEHNLYFD